MANTTRALRRHQKRLQILRAARLYKHYHPRWQYWSYAPYYVWDRKTRAGQQSGLRPGRGFPTDHELTDNLGVWRHSMYGPPKWLKVQWNHETRSAYRMAMFGDPDTVQFFKHKRLTNVRNWY